jgi:hypothetical protein
MTNASDSRPNQQPTDHPELDEHPDAGLEEFERTGSEDADLADVDEDEKPLPHEPASDAAPPLTSPPQDSR